MLIPLTPPIVSRDVKRRIRTRLKLLPRKPRYERPERSKGSLTDKKGNFKKEEQSIA
jgi:hypothetical protein